LQPQEALLVTGFDQLVAEGGGGGEGDRKALLAGGKAQARRDVGLDADRVLAGDAEKDLDQADVRAPF
jgi:hypothetical protein